MDFTPSRPGQVNATGTVDTLFYKKFAGEVLLAFQDVNKLMPLHMVRNIKSGKSAAFPNFGKATTAYHTPGTELNGRAIKGNEMVISIDSLLTSDVFIANIDEAMSEYEVRSIYSGEVGRSLGLKADQQVGRVLVLAARASSSVSGGDDGTASNFATTNARTVAANAAIALFGAANALDSKNVPGDNRYAMILPVTYYALISNTVAINQDWGGSGSYNDGKVLRIAGIEIVKSNNLPTANASVVAGEVNAYNGTFNAVAGVVWHKSAVGTVKLLDLAVESEYSVRHQGTLVVAKYAMGHGILRPESAVEIVND